MPDSETNAQNGNIKLQCIICSFWLLFDHNADLNNLASNQRKKVKHCCYTNRHILVNAKFMFIIITKMGNLANLPFCLTTYTKSETGV